MVATTRVRHVITTLDPGGAENHLLRLVRGFDPGRFEIRVAFLKGDGRLAPRFREVGVEVDRWPLAGALDPARLGGLVARFRQERPRIVHTHLFKADFYGGLAAWFAGVPIILSTKHNEDPELDHPLYGPLGRLVHRVDSKVVAISHAVRRHVVRTLGGRSRIRVIPYGIDPPSERAGDGRSSVRTEFGIPEGAPLVVLVSRLEPQKDVDTFLRAASRVQSARSDVRFAVVGAGSQEARLRQLAGELGLGSSLVFTGFRGDIPNILEQATVVALTSRWEGFGLVLLEAMAAGSPIVATATGPTPEVVGPAGLLSPVGDDRGIAESILAVVSHPELALRLGRLGKERARTEFQADRMVERTKALYLDLLERKRHRW